jgi:HAE1 family hydrophobic/amphiphilic exporter-1
MVISIMVVVMGSVAIMSLPIAQFPEIVPPEIQISTTYVGADAETVEKAVTTPIEQQLSGVDNMNYMCSLNANDGTLRLTASFDVATNPNTDLILTQIRQNLANLQLPSDVLNYGVTVQKALSAPLMIFSLL